MALPLTGRFFTARSNWEALLDKNKKNKKHNAIFSNIDGPRDCHTEKSKSNIRQKDKYVKYAESKKKDTNELIYKTEVALWI